MAISERVTLGCLPDRIGEAAITAGADASVSLAAANVQTLDPDESWRCGYFSARKSWIKASWAGVAKKKQIESLSFIGNLSQNALYRVRADGYATDLTLWQRMPPTSIAGGSVGVTNFAAGAVDIAEFNEDCDTGMTSPNGGARLTTGASSNMQLLFAVPTTACRTGVAVQEMRIIAYLERSGTGDDVSVLIGDNGASMAGVPTFTIPAEDLTTSPKEFVFQWDAQYLTLADGSQVTLDISTHVAGGGTVDVVIEAVEWNQYPTGDGGAEYDSGILSAFDTFASQQFGDALLVDGFTGVNWTHGIPFGATVSDTYQVVVEFWDMDLKVRSTPNYYWDDDIPAIEIGMLRAGPIYLSTRGMARGWSMGVINAGTSSRNMFGTSMPRSRYKKRKVTLELRHVPHGEAMQNLYLWLGLYSGGEIPFAIYPEPSRTGVQTLQNGFYKVAGSIEVRNSAPGHSTITINAEEW